MVTTGNDVPQVADLHAAERRLQAAQLAADATELDTLLDDRLVFTGPDGLLYSKQDDLDIQRSGQQQLSRLSEEDLQVLVVGDTGLTWFLGTLEGVFKDQPFSARVRYTRTWIRTEQHGWRVLAAHVSSV
jgi:hypothetical protein